MLSTLVLISNGLLIAGGTSGLVSGNNRNRLLYIASIAVGALGILMELAVRF